MKQTRYWLWGIGFAVAFVAGVVAVLTVLAKQVQETSRNLEKVEAQMDELRADVEAANNQLLIMQAEADLRLEQLRRLLEGERDEWDSSN